MLVLEINHQDRFWPAEPHAICQGTSPRLLPPALVKYESTVEEIGGVGQARFPYKHVILPL